MNYEIIRLIDKPEIKEQAAEWFHTIVAVFTGNSAEVWRLDQLLSDQMAE